MNTETETVFHLDEIAIPLQLDPNVWAPTSFAQHLATQLKPVIQAGDRVLEIGLGSGVLAILAAKLGAAHVTALDINENAIALARTNWRNNGLNPSQADFRHSDLLQALQPTDQAQFDVIFSNPPVLPELNDSAQKQHNRDDFEISGCDGRRVLDTVLSQTGKYLKPNGHLLTIATSLQGWQETETLLNRYWQQWQLKHTIAMELTDECTPPYLAYWQRREQEDGRPRTYLQGEKRLHDVWFLHAGQPR